MRNTRIFAVVVAIAAACTTAAVAQPSVSQKTKTYKVSATNVDGILKEMAERGPNGHWGYTDWYVRWTGDCKLSVTIDYTLPRHSKPSAMPADVRKKFDTMLAALTKHENQHGRHAVMAAEEIEKAGCKGGDAIIRKYNGVDKAYDKQTKHGLTEGVVFK